MSEYQKKYYLAHKEEIRARRLERYWNDPEHREMLLKTSRDRRAESRGPSTKEIGRPFVVNGGSVRLFTTGIAARRLGVKKSYLTAVLRDVPTPFVHKRVRYLSYEQVEEIQSAIADGLRGKELREAIKDRWSYIGVPAETSIDPI